MRLINLLKGKIHRATVTESDLNYEGSIGIDSNLLKEAGILEFEKVDVLNINNGTRFSTYVISEEAGSGVIKINGAAARMVHRGDLVIIVAYVTIPESELGGYCPKVVMVDGQNKIKND